MKARVIAYYLPQYHPIPENDKWWGKGFTEWRNVGKAKPLFKGHEQPRVPADLGYYDLRLAEVRKQQAELAREAGIEGFCYWHYWFGNGKQLLEMPFNEVLKSGEPDFPFCLGWANHSWTSKTWVVGNTFQKDSMIMEQTYPGMEDHKAHFYTMLPAFKDKRYIKVDGKLLFVVFRPLDIPECDKFIVLWNELAKVEGLEGFHFVGVESSFGMKSTQSGKIMYDGTNTTKKLYDRIFNVGFDGINSRGMNLAHVRYDSVFTFYLKKVFKKYLKWNGIVKYNYQKVTKLLFNEEDKHNNVYPTIIPNWDRSPRSGKNAIVWYNNHPAYFKEQVKLALDYIKDKPDDHKILFLMSWNEWGEGNYMEPDITFGKGYIESLRAALEE